MARLLKLIARFSDRVPLLGKLTRVALPNPLAFLAGKPLERWLMVYDLGRRSLALGNDPQTVERVMLDREGTFPKSTLLEALLRPLIGQGLFGQPGGPAVKAARRLFIRTVARIKDDEIATVSRSVTRSYVQDWANSQPPEGIPIGTQLARLTVDIVSECALQGRFSTPESVAFAANFLTYHRQCSPLQMLLSRRDPSAYRQLARGMGLERVGETLRCCVRARFLAPLMAHESPALGSPFALALEEAQSSSATGPAPDNSERVLDEIMVLLLAGHETTASVLTWLLWELARRPVLQERAASRLAQPVNAEEKRQPAVQHDNYSGVDAGTLLHGLTREALRLYPPIAFFLRDVEVETPCRGKTIRQGSFFVVSPWALHRHRKYWERPEEFRPERWWAQSPPPPRTSYLPFGMGPRACPGAHFAEIEMSAILEVLLTECRFSVVGQQNPKPLGSLTSRPDREIYLRVERRSPGAEL